MAYRIEPATVMHLPWLRMLFVRMGAEQAISHPQFDEEEYDNFIVLTARHLANNPNYFCFVAIIGRRVVGFITGEICDRAVGKPHRYGECYLIYVVPKHRKHGVSLMLSAAGIQWVLDRGVTSIEWTRRFDDHAFENNAIPYITRYHWLPLTDTQQQKAVG